MKKLKILIITTILMTLMTSCGGSSLVGQWKCGSSTLEFFSNGTYKSNDPNYYGDYSVDGDRLMLEGVLMPSVTTTFKVSGDTLTMYDDNGNIDGEYTRIR